MIRWFLNRRLTAFEKQFDYDISYMRELLAIDVGAFWRFSRILGVSSYRKDVPLETSFAASIAAALSEDCGPCTQLVVTMAERQGVSPATLRAILADDRNAMTPEAALGLRFAQAVLSRSLAEADTLRTEIVKRWGRRALVSLAFVISAARVCPTVKYALGYGRACTQVRVADANAPLAHRELHV
jgi:hypothetical protein